MWRARKYGQHNRFPQHRPQSARLQLGCSCPHHAKVQSLCPVTGKGHDTDRWFEASRCKKQKDRSRTHLWGNILRNLKWWKLLASFMWIHSAHSDLTAPQIKSLSKKMPRLSSFTNGNTSFPSCWLCLISGKLKINNAKTTRIFSQIYRGSSQKSFGCPVWQEVSKMQGQQEGTHASKPRTRPRHIVHPRSSATSSTQPEDL